MSGDRGWVKVRYLTGAILACSLLAAVLDACTGDIVVVAGKSQLPGSTDAGFDAASQDALPDAMGDSASPEEAGMLDASDAAFDQDARPMGPAVCGNGVVENGEACDDGNASNTDACLNTCKKNACGDGFKQEGAEECDDGNTSNDDDCLDTCLIPTCGDGFVQAGVEECDDGNLIDDDGCTAHCTVGAPARCGNTVTETGEECDDGNSDDTDACLDTCKQAKCGDGLIHQGVEQCDDGNTDNDDGCLDTCLTATCGDGFVQTGVEECDSLDRAACNADCTAVECGDGVVQGTFEQCEPPGVLNCGSDCRFLPASCGNGVTEAGEECDDGNVDDSDDCLSNCKAPTCGDGVVWAGKEDCDPPGSDGCDDNCHLGLDCDSCSTDQCLDQQSNFDAVCAGNTCSDYRACILSTDCAATDLRQCYCGTIPFESCFGVFTEGDPNQPNGPCRDAILALAGNTTPNFFDASQPLGATNQLALCQASQCSDLCAPNLCGNGHVDPGEDCDDGNQDDTDDCLSTCVAASCGDGKVHAGFEECDDKNQSNEDGCLNTCALATCGDGFLRQGVEQCEPPSTASCDANCQNTAQSCDQCTATNCPNPIADRDDLCAGGVCDSYISCLDTTNCAASDVRECYCGTVAFTDCFDVFADASLPNGACKAEITALANATIPLQVGTKFFDAAGALGAVNQVVLCQANACSNACP